MNVANVESMSSRRFDINFKSKNAQCRVCRVCRRVPAENAISKKVPSTYSTYSTLDKNGGVSQRKTADFQCRVRVLDIDSTLDGFLL